MCTLDQFAMLGGNFDVFRCTNHSISVILSPHYLTVLLIFTVILGVALIFSLGVNVHFWSKRHSMRSYKGVKVDAPPNEQGLLK